MRSGGSPDKSSDSPSIVQNYEAVFKGLSLHKEPESAPIVQYEALVDVDSTN